MENGFILQDRLQKIRQIINQYGEDNFYISFSGGRDSCVLSALVDLAIPNNQIPRIYSNTGIEYDLIIDFVNKLQLHDERIKIIKPDIPIKKMLDKEGYPFKSKEHSAVVNSFQNGNTNGKWINKYLNTEGRWGCPDNLKYQFTDANTLKISDKCCYKLKEEPLLKYTKNIDKPFGIVGIMRAEGGRRNNSKCLAFRGGKLKNFQPLVPITKKWEQWFIETYKVEICDIYKEPYNFERTGCKGCPFNPHLQKSLDTLEKYFPNERKQCEIIWKPVYNEYRRLNYRLKGEER